LLARMKVLRGTPLDPFGRTAERRLERQLISDYEALLKRVASGLRADNRDAAEQLLAAPEKMRGFGHVKDQAVVEVRNRMTDLEAAFRAPAPSGDKQIAAE
jgi:indolepyruvate ferredoxin oxidoreductase